jgi:hypothetical protein
MQVAGSVVEKRILVLTFDDLVKKHRSVMTDVNAQIEHARKGTTDDFYKQMIDDLITDITLMPIYRDSQELEQINDRDVLEASISAVMEMMSIAFGKNKKTVENDFRKALRRFPVDDVREAGRLKANNRLN